MGNLQQKPKKNQEKPPVNDEEEEEEEDVSTFTCEICIEPISSNKKFKNKDRCVHPFCMDCMAKYIHVKVEDNVGNVECPGLNCNQFLDPITCRPIVPTRVFDVWCDRLCDSALLGFEKCYCPCRDCSALILNECGGIVKRSECPNCKKLFCFKCKLPWHAGYRCNESEEMRDRNDVLFRQLVESKKWSRCPRCGHCVELIRGCSMVECRCKTRFCYNCGRMECVCYNTQENVLRSFFIVLCFLNIIFIVIRVLRRMND